MTEMLQKSENVANNVANKNSQDLTDKWKKGKIPEAWYYVKDIHNKESLDRYFKETDNFEYLEDWEVDEVLAPVPSYEEMQSMNEAVNQAMAANIKLVEENKQLKELLKEVKDYLPEFETPMDILAKIDEVLK